MVVGGREVWGSPAIVVEVSECSTDVVAGTEVEVPGCSAAEVVCGCSVDVGDVVCASKFRVYV